MPKRKYPLADHTPAAKLTERIASSLQNQPPVDAEDDSDQQGKADLGRIDTYLYWNAFDHDRPK